MLQSDCYCRPSYCLATCHLTSRLLLHCSQNDGFGGGTNVTSNLIYNQCRESGDHGAMNAWDRTAYISDVYNGKPSYTAQMNGVYNNFIIANYGASQGFDTDDGSSW